MNELNYYYLSLDIFYWFVLFVVNSDIVKTLNLFVHNISDIWCFLMMVMLSIVNLRTSIKSTCKVSTQSEMIL